MKSGLSSFKTYLSGVVGWLLIAVLFLRTIWGMWNVRDLTSGDTSYYYIPALQFSKRLVCNFAWSPIYTSYFGAWHWINSDPYFVVIAHRIGILAMLTVLIYLVSRRLLPGLIAWLVTAWWIILPINYNALYEVHLFALIPVCLFWFLISVSSRMEIRGICVGLILACTFLMRNELLITLLIFSTLSIGWDYWEFRKNKTAALSISRYLRAYGIPILVALILVGISYGRSTRKFPNLSKDMLWKHTLNISQIYTFGYGQRHPEFKDSPWVGYKKLMKRDFGHATLTMKEAIMINPRAMLDHFLWNISLFPNGLQVALFNCRAGQINPDYAATKYDYTTAFCLSLAYCVLVSVGLTLLAVHRKFWYEYWLKQRIWLLVAILSICVTVAVVMVMQRPRPSYMFALTLALMWLAGFSLQIILHHLRAERFVEKIAILPIAAIAFLVPGGFSVSALPPPSRPLLTQLRLLQDHKETLKKASAVSGYPFEINSYLGFEINARNAMDETVSRHARQRFTSLDDLLKRGQGRSLLDKLAESEASFFILPFNVRKNPSVIDFEKDAEANGWIKAAVKNDFGREYILYAKKPGAVAPKPPAVSISQ